MIAPDDWPYGTVKAVLVERTERAHGVEVITLRECDTGEVYRLLIGRAAQKQLSHVRAGDSGVITWYCGLNGGRWDYRPDTEVRP